MIASVDAPSENMSTDPRPHKLQKRTPSLSRLRPTRNDAIERGTRVSSRSPIFPFGLHRNEGSRESFASPGSPPLTCNPVPEGQRRRSRSESISNPTIGTELVFRSSEDDAQYNANLEDMMENIRLLRILSEVEKAVPIISAPPAAQNKPQRASVEQGGMPTSSRSNRPRQTLKFNTNIFKNPGQDTESLAPNHSGEVLEEELNPDRWGHLVKLERRAREASEEGLRKASMSSGGSTTAVDGGAPFRTRKLSLLGISKKSSVSIEQRPEVRLDPANEIVSSQFIPKPSRKAQVVKSISVEPTEAAIMESQESGSSQRRLTAPTANNYAQHPTAKRVRRPLGPRPMSCVKIGSPRPVMNVANSIAYSNHRSTFIALPKTSSHQTEMSRLSEHNCCNSTVAGRMCGQNEDNLQVVDNMTDIDRDRKFWEADEHHIRKSSDLSLRQPTLSQISLNKLPGEVEYSEGALVSACESPRQSRFDSDLAQISSPVQPIQEHPLVPPTTPRKESENDRINREVNFNKKLPPLPSLFPFPTLQSDHEALHARQELSSRERSYSPSIFDRSPSPIEKLRSTQQYYDVRKPIPTQRIPFPLIQSEYFHRPTTTTRVRTGLPKSNKSTHSLTSKTPKKSSLKKTSHIYGIKSQSEPQINSNSRMNGHRTRFDSVTSEEATSVPKQVMFDYDEQEDFYDRPNQEYQRPKKLNGFRRIWQGLTKRKKKDKS